MQNFSPQFSKEQRSSLNNFLVSSVLQIVKDAKVSISAGDFFNCLCRLSVLVENLEKNMLERLIHQTNLYTVLLSAVFTNQSFSEKLIAVVREEKGKFGKDADELNVDTKKILNASLSLAFFPVALMLQSLSKENIVFLRKHITHLVKFNLKATNDYSVSFSNLCFKIESVSWNYRYNYTDTFPVFLNDKFLFGTLQIARVISGISLLSLTINTILGEQFKNTVEKMGGEHFNLLKALNNIHSTVFRIEASTQSYYNNVPIEKRIDLERFFDTFVWNNEKDLAFFVKEISTGFLYKEGGTPSEFRDAILAKVAVAGESKNKLITFAEKNLSAFTGTLVGVEREWANKIFIVLKGTHFFRHSFYSAILTDFAYGRQIQRVAF